MNEWIEGAASLHTIHPCTFFLSPPPNQTQPQLQTQQVQLSVAAALGRLLLDSAAPPSSLSPLQLQLALGQLTLLLPTLGEGAGPALLSLCSSSLLPSSSSSYSSSPADTAHSLPHLPRRLLALCRHGSYGVRVEASVALASLVRVSSVPLSFRGHRKSGRLVAHDSQCSPWRSTPPNPMHAGPPLYRFGCAGGDGVGRAPGIRGPRAAHGGCPCRGRRRRGAFFL